MSEEQMVRNVLSNVVKPKVRGAGVVRRAGEIVCQEPNKTPEDYNSDSLKSREGASDHNQEK